MPIAVVAVAKTIVWAKMPGIKYSRYDAPPGSGIAPPKTNVNSSTNMIDCRIANRASSGIRGTRFRFRHPTTRPSLSAWRAVLPAIRTTRCRSDLGRVPGERQKDIVKRRAAEGDVVDCDLRLV